MIEGGGSTFPLLLISRPYTEEYINDIRRCFDFKLNVFVSLLGFSPTSRTLIRVIN